MARKTAVKKSKTEHKKEHHKSHSNPEKESKVSFFSKVSAFFSEALKAPPEEPKKQISKIEESDGNVKDASSQYELASHIDGQKMDASSEVDDDDDSDEDDAPDEESNDGKSEILSILNDATNKWKESGDTGLHLEPPKSWSERMRTLWTGVNVQSTRLSGRLKVLMHEVSERVAARQKEAKAEGVKVKTDDLVKEEWKSVLTKLESVSTPSERDEIEKIYKQLENV
jgi:hypothetical protein